MCDKDYIHYHVVRDYDGDGEGFKELRLKGGLNQDELAKAIGFSNKTVVSMIENGDFGLESRTYTLFMLLVDAHPEYELKPKLDNQGELLVEPPSTGDEVRQFRDSVKPMSQAKMAKLLSLNDRQLVSKYERDIKKPSVQTWTLWLLITNEHPHYFLRRKGIYTIFNKSEELFTHLTWDASAGEGLASYGLSREEVAGFQSITNEEYYTFIQHYTNDEQEASNYVLSLLGIKRGSI